MGHEKRHDREDREENNTEDDAVQQGPLMEPRPALVPASAAPNDNPSGPDKQEAQKPQKEKRNEAVEL